MQKIHAVILLTSMCISYFVQAENSLIIVAEHFPPYQIKGNTGVTGLSIDVLNAMNTTLSIDESVQIYPWSRAYKMALNIPNTLILGIAKTKERTELFRWVGILASKDTPAIWTLKENQSQIEINWDNITQFRTALPREDSNLKILMDKGLKINDNLFLVNQFEQVIGMLRKGRIDYIIAGKNTLEYQIISMGLNKDSFQSKVINEFPSAPLAIAFSKNSDEELVKRYQEAFQHLAQKGEIEDLTRKWLLE